MPKCDFNKVALQLRHGCSPVNFPYIFRTYFLKNTSGWLLLKNSPYLPKALQRARIHDL